MTDNFGNELSIGDRVYYASPHAILKATVLDINPNRSSEHISRLPGVKILTDFSESKSGRWAWGSRLAIIPKET